MSKVPATKSFDDFYNERFTEEQKRRIERNVELMKTLIEIREEQGLSQRDLAKKAGVKQPSIARLERLVTTPKIDTLNELLDPMGYKLAIVKKKT